MRRSDPLLAAVGAAVGVIAVLPALAVAAEALAFALHVPGVVALIERIAPICHHLPARTLALWGRPLPVCARCTGMYLGLAAGGLAGLGLGGLAERRQPLLRALALAGVALTLLGLVAAIAEAAGAIATSNEVRLLLGLALGVGPTLYAGLGARLLLNLGDGRSPRQDLRGRRSETGGARPRAAQG